VIFCLEKLILYSFKVYVATICYHRLYVIKRIHSKIKHAYFDVIYLKIFNPLCIWSNCLKKQPQSVIITWFDRVMHSEAGSNTVRKLSIWVEILHHLLQMTTGIFKIKSCFYAIDK